MKTKKIWGFLLAACLATTSYAQPKFPMEYTVKFPVSPDYKMINQDRSLVLEGDMNELAMLDATNGKVLWMVNFKEKFGTKKAKDWSWDKQKGYVWISFKGESKSQEVTYYLDEMTGAKIDDITRLVAKQDKIKRTSKLRNKSTAKTSVYIESKGVTVSLSYERRLITGSAGKGTKTKIKVSCSGNTTWTTNIEGLVLRSLCENALGSWASTGGDFIDLSVQGDRVFVIYEGISAIDLNTGAVLWNTSFDNTDYDFGLMKSVQTIGRAGIPVSDNSGVYIADLSKGVRAIKKLDLNTGAVIWQSEKLDKDAIVPEMMILDGALMVRFGGKVLTQTYIPSTGNGVPDRCNVAEKMIGDYGVKAYDCKSGAVLWETSKMKPAGDKFSGSISEFNTDGKSLYVASDKNVFAFEPKSGKVIFSVPAKNLKIGKPAEIYLADNNQLLITGDKGVAMIKNDNGNVVFGTPTGKCLGIQIVGDALFVWVGSKPGDLKDFVRVDLQSGAILGKMKATPYPFFTPDGEAFVKFDGGKMMRFKTR